MALDSASSNSQEGLLDVIVQGETANQHKRDAPELEMEPVKSTKRIRVNYLTTHIPSTALVEIRILHSKGTYDYLGHQKLVVFPDWASNDPFPFMDEAGVTEKYLDELLPKALAPETYRHTLELMVLLSQQKNVNFSNEPSTTSLVPILSGDNDQQTLQAQLPIMLAAAKRAQQYVTTFKQSPALARLRLILSYVTLYVTLEFGLVPELRAESTKPNMKIIGGRKWDIFYERLGGKQELGCSVDALRDNVAFGKILWTWATECGLMWLPVLAVMDTGITSFARKNAMKYKRSQIMGSKLSTQSPWIALCNAFSGVLVNLLFSPTSPEYTFTQLCQRYLQQTNSTKWISSFNHAIWDLRLDHLVYDEIWQLQPIIPVVEAAAGTLFSALNLKVPVLPSTGTSHLLKQEVNLVDWVLNADPDSVIELKIPRVEDGSVSILQIIDLACLFGPIPLTQRVIGFLTEMFDTGGLLGWQAISIEEGVRLFSMEATGSVHEAIQAVLHSESTFEYMNHLLIPVETEHSYFLYYCHLNNREISIFYWNDSRDMDQYLDELVEVSSTIVLYERCLHLI